jgi:homoserine O-acetyltransferase
MVFSIDSDVCFYPSEQLKMVRELKKAKVPCRYITVHSDKGHDSFLLEPELYTPYIAYTLENEW